jgi:3-dehydroquinate dehydratase-2
MAKILVIHGAGMNMRGKVMVDVFGPLSLAEYDKKIQGYAAELGVEVETFQSNIVGEVINKVYDAHDGPIDAIVINPAGFLLGTPALAGAIRQVRVPSIEVHVSNPANRGTVSEIAPACRGVVTGFGVFTYFLALRAAVSLLAEGG